MAFRIILTLLITVFIGVFMYYIGSLTLFGESGVATIVNETLSGQSNVPAEAWQTINLMTTSWTIWIFIFVLSLIVWAFIMIQRREPEYVGY